MYHTCTTVEEVRPGLQPTRATRAATHTCDPAAVFRGCSCIPRACQVRRQFAEKPGIMDGSQLPDYNKCVSIVAAASLKEMRKPGLLALGLPIFVGFAFRFLGGLQGKPLLGPMVLAGMLMVATITGILMSLFLNNAGGAWDNAKKYIETGKYGGKGSEAHKAAVTGDTVGDPFKDTAGPSLHVLIKLLSTISLVLGPLFIASE